MSWLDKIHDAVREAEATGNRKVADDMFQAALSDMNGKLQAVTNTIDPCDYCLNKGTDICFGCAPTKFEPVTRIALMRRMDAEELAEFLKSELNDSVPADWLAWLTDAVAPSTMEVRHETS